MQAEEDASARAAHAAVDAEQLTLSEFSADSPTTTIAVMVASGRTALHAAWLPRLSCEPSIEVRGEPVTDSAHLAACMEHHLPDVLLLDKALLDGLDPQSLRKIREHCRHVRVLLLWHEICQGLVADVLRNRFHGYLLTTSLPDICLQAIQAVSKGELWLSRASLAEAIAELLGLPAALDTDASADAAEATEALTPRELQVVELLRRGCSNKEIARDLGIMEDTVKKHLQSVFAKLGVHRRALVALRRLPAMA